MTRTHTDLPKRRKVLSEGRLLRCDHCRKLLGAIVHRYWGMRFCSADCVIAYKRRLSEETRAKISFLCAA
jgi:hypothetical protein